MRVAVTGGSGFVGSHVVDRLIEAGHDVTVLDRRLPHRRDVGFHRTDVTDAASLARGLRHCDVVFHLAAVADVDEAFRRPAEAVAVNVGGTANVCEAARRGGVGRVVLASTVWVYGAAHGDEPLTEDVPFALDQVGHLYVATKLAAEMVVTSYHELYGQPFTILRYGIPFGPRMRDELVVARFVRMALAGELITVHGDGSQFRNYVYVEDLADAHVLALDDDAEDGVFNLEGAEPVTVRDIVEAVRNAVDGRVAVEFVPARAGDYAGRRVSGERARAVLGWEPRTSFEEGVSRYLDWYLSRDGRPSHRDLISGRVK